MDEENQRKLLDSYIDYASSKYGKDNVYLYLDNYIKGNVRAITRDNNFRNNFEIYLKPNNIYYLCNGDVDSYIKNRLQNNTINDTQKYNIFIYLATEMINHFGNEGLAVALAAAVNYNDFSHFKVGSDDYINTFKSYISPADIQRYCMQYLTQIGYNLSNIDSNNYDNIFIHFSAALKQQLINDIVMQNQSKAV